MKKILTCILGVLLGYTAHAQEVIRLYEGKAPGSESWTWQESVLTNANWGGRTAYNIVDPTITAYLPSVSKANGTAIVVAPGGAFHTLSMDNEGVDVAKWLNERGIAAFVLKYRVARSFTDNPITELMGKMSNMKALDQENAAVIPLATQDGRKAIQYIRQNAEKFHVNPNKIGMMGFSAGGTLTMSVVYTANDAERPNFVAPIYAYEKAILGNKVPTQPTPIFVAAASDDQLGFTLHSSSIYGKWTQAKQPAELHIYEKGGHGFGMSKKNIPTDTWIERFGDWLQLHGLTTPEPPAPGLAFFCEIKVLLSEALTVGQTPHGLRRIIPIVGGTFEGPSIKGQVLSGGADWQIVRSDGVAELDANYQIKTDDGVIIYVKNNGLRVASPEIAAKIAKGENVDPSQYYFRTIPKLEAPKGRYEWVNNSLFLCKGIRKPDHVLIQIWAVK